MLERAVRRVNRASLSILLASVCTAERAHAQAPERGVHKVDPRWHALVHATLVPRPGEVVEDATIVMRDGLIVSVEAGGAVPVEGARVWDATGLFVYAGFVDAHVPVETRLPDASRSHWNSLVTPERSALDGAGLSVEAREELRALGFTAACIAPSSGILRGTSTLVALGEPATDTESQGAEVLALDRYQAFALETAGPKIPAGSKGPGYPSSKMGAIALFRQTLLDADDYARRREVYARAPDANEPPHEDDALAVLGSNTPLEGARVAGGPPFLFEAADELAVLRAARLAGEFSRALVVKGSGTEFRRLDAIAALGLPLVVPLAFPDEPRVATLAQAEQVDLRALMTFEQAPTNPRRLAGRGLLVALTTDDLEERADFQGNLREAVRHGLAPDEALAMLTLNPARILGVPESLGQVAPGFLAHLVVTDGPWLDEETQVREVWIGGRRYEVEPPDRDHAGEWTGAVAGLFSAEEVTVSFSVGEEDLKVVVLAAESKARAFERDRERIAFLLDGDAFAREGTWSFSGMVEGETLHGTFTAPDGTPTHVRLARSGDAAEESEDEEADEPPQVPEDLPIPFGAYGRAELPAQATLLLTHATVWTSGPDGIVEDGAVLLRAGKLEYVGPTQGAPRPADALELDLSGKHVTPGLIDCHSHTGLDGDVNEMGRRVSAEVRTADVIDPDDVNWYRQLAGGLTAANQLHGSGNAIGGQSSVVKLRWGAALPEDMLLAGAPAGIKFALGENPKRVARMTELHDEYPQTRMGVAALIEDRLRAGRAYRAEWERYGALSEEARARAMPPRRDLELEALGEVMAGTRLVHCHSYRQDEILMMCELAGELGFTIGTFQHVLEGYKVAEAIRAAALGASTFSDWWGYKFEVVDAIPHNAAILHDVGVVASIGSDSNDHARRLATEAAKSMKYGGLEPAEALALVTLNPAIQLGVSDRIGSLEAGKDADLAVWSGDPLSYTSRCERTFVDGRELYSLESDRELRANVLRERARIVQEIRASGKKEKDDEGDDEEEAQDPTSDPGVAPERARDRGQVGIRSSVHEGDFARGECGCVSEELR